MKKTIFPILISLLLLYAGCKKDDQFTTGIAATKNGTNWIAANFGTGFKPLNTKDTLFITANNKEEHLLIALKQVSKGVFQLVDQTNFYVTVGYDVVVAAYRLDNTSANQVTITAYDENTRQLKATFDLTFNSTRTDGQADKIKFSNGKINIPLNDVYMNPFIPQ